MYIRKILPLVALLSLAACDGGDTTSSSQAPNVREGVARDASVGSCGPTMPCPNGGMCVLGRCNPNTPQAGGMQAPQAGMTTVHASMGGDNTSSGGQAAGGSSAQVTAGSPSGGIPTGGGPAGGTQPMDCSRDFDCPMGNRCDDGTCIPRNPMPGGAAMPMGGRQAGGPCMVTADCPDGLSCEEQRCVACRVDANCDDGQRCEEGNCEAIPPECVMNEDCQGDGGQRCIDGMCIPNRCFGDNQCPNGERCIRGTCYRGERGDGSGSCQRPTPLVVGEVARGRPNGGQQHSGSCSISADRSGVEAVFTFTPDFTDAVCMTTAWYSFPGFIPDLYMRQAVCDGQMEIGCAESNGGQYPNLMSMNTQAVLEAQVNAGQTYFVFVDARTGIDADDAYVLSAHRGACNTISLPTACDETAHTEIGQPFNGNSKFGSRAFEGTCGDFGDDGEEQVVHFRSGENGGPICVRIDPNAAGDVRDIYVRKTNCSDGDEVACTDERNAANRKLNIMTEADTDYFVFVDSLSSGSEYRLLIDEGACP